MAPSRTARALVLSAELASRLNDRCVTWGARITEGARGHPVVMIDSGYRNRTGLTYRLGGWTSVTWLMNDDGSVAKEHAAVLLATGRGSVPEVVDRLADSLAQAYAAALSGCAANGVPADDPQVLWFREALWHLSGRPPGQWP